MPRTGSSTSSTARTSRRKKADEVPAEATVETTEAPETTEATEAEVDSTEAPEAEVTPEATEEAPSMSTETVEPEVDETPASDTTEATETATPEVSEADTKAAEAEAANEALFTEFEAAVTTALNERDSTTGTVPEVQVEAVKEKYRNLPGAKYKNRAKKHFNDQLKSAVNEQDLIKGTAVMSLHDAIENAGPAPRATATERKPADPAAAFRDRVATLHLAYNLARENAPEGVDVDAELPKVEEKVGELTDQAATYYAWVVSTAEDKGVEPEVDPLVKRAVKAAQGKAATAGRAASGTSTPRVSDGVRRNVRTHIAQVFKDEPSGAYKKVAEIAKAATEEYPAADCSPGAISAALKSEKGVPGFKMELDENQHVGARKL